MMIAGGLAQEVSQLLADGVAPDCQAMRGIGYKEMLRHIQGECGLAEASQEIKKATRHFAKRQLTWYRKMPYIHWYHPALYKGHGLLDNVTWNIARFFNH